VGSTILNQHTPHLASGNTRRATVSYQTEFRGRIINVSRKGDYGFVGRNTISRMDGKDLGIDFRHDLRLHVKKNRELSDPLPWDVTVRFFLGPDPHSRDGFEVLGARLL